MINITNADAAGKANDAKVVVVTGGNRGIGFEICRQLAQRGVQVMLTARQPEAGQTAMRKLAEQNLPAQFHLLDVTDRYTGTEENNMKPIIGVLLADAFQDSEYFLPKIEIEKMGVPTQVISLDSKPVEIYSYFSRIGTLDVDKTIGDADPADYIGVLIPGGAKSPALLAESEEALSFLRRVSGEQKLVASICRGSLLVARSGIAKDRRLTGFHRGDQYPDLVIRPIVEKYGGIWSDDQPVVVDANLISSRHPDDVPQFSNAIREWLSQHQH